MHLAAESHVDRSIDGPGAFIQTNIVGTYVLLQAALGYWRGLPASRASALSASITFSTDEVFGSLGDEGLFREDTPYAPNSPYSASKAASDHLVRAWDHTYGLPTVVTNCSNNYGPYHFPEKLIPLMISMRWRASRCRSMARRECARLALCRGPRRGAADGRAARARSARPTISAAATNAATSTWSRRSATSSTNCAPRPQGSHARLITFVADRPGHDLRYAIDAAKIERELGWTAGTRFEDGLRKTVRWYLDNRRWWRDIRSGVYRGERLGLRLSGRRVSDV